MYSKLTFITFLSAAITCATAAENSTSHNKAITDAYLVCSNKPGSTCPHTYDMADCLEGIEPTIWEKYDANHNATDISTTPLGRVIKNAKLKTCVCSDDQLQGLQQCVNCVRKESQLVGAIDLFGVGFIAERVCGVVLPGFELPQEGRTDDRKVVDQPPTTNLTTTLPANGTGTTGPTATPFPNSNGTLQTPTPTQARDQPSASQSSGAAVANAVVKHVAVPAGMAAVVAFGMSLL